MPYGTFVCTIKNAELVTVVQNRLALFCLWECPLFGFFFLGGAIVLHYFSVPVVESELILIQFCLRDVENL